MESPRKGKERMFVYIPLEQHHILKIYREKLKEKKGYELHLQKILNIKQTKGLTRRLQIQLAAINLEIFVQL